jgi:hypothetical protein
MPASPLLCGIKRILQAMSTPRLGILVKVGLAIGVLQIAYAYSS